MNGPPTNERTGLEEISALANALRDAVDRSARQVQAQPTTGELAQRAQTILRLRAERDKLFGHDAQGLFGEPSYEILLDLYLRSILRQEVSVSSACIASRAPATTALRLLRKLEVRGYVRRHGDPFDGRRSFVELTDHARDLIIEWLGACHVR